MLHLDKYLNDVMFTLQGPTNNNDSLIYIYIKFPYSYIYGSLTKVSIAGGGSVLFPHIHPLFGKKGQQKTA